MHRSVLADNVLLSWHDLQKLGVLPVDFPRAQRCSAGDELKERAIKEFKDILSDELGSKPMAGPPMKIQFKQGVNPKPRCHAKAREVPFHQDAEARKLVDDLIKRGVIAKVNTPTPWVSPAFHVPKKGNKLRLVTDFTAINNFLERPVHPFPSSGEIMRGGEERSKVFLKLDAVHGYFQMALDKDSQELTTFLLPTGRFKYLRGPMGLKPTSDEWCLRSEVI